MSEARHDKTSHDVDEKLLNDEIAQKTLGDKLQDDCNEQKSTTVIEDNKDQDLKLSKSQAINNEVDNSSSSRGQPSEQQQQHLDAECERLLRNAKKQVKQMMEEAVTKKFIHEDSSSIISLCVSIEGCLLHGLKRRALGLFKTNSSTALVQKISKTCPEAQDIIDLVEVEEKRLQEELKLISKQEQAIANQNQLMQKSPRRQQRKVVASNLTVHKRNLWIKCALLEKKLVFIVEHLAENASKFYESEALMANPLSAQLLCSLLVGPCALEFSRSKTNDYYKFEEPSADELLKRHKLSNPVACLCSTNGEPTTSSSISPLLPTRCSFRRLNKAARQHANSNNPIGRCQSASLNRDKLQTQTLARSATDSNNDNGRVINKHRHRRATTSQTSDSDYIQEARRNSLMVFKQQVREQEQETKDGDQKASRSSSPSGLVRKESRRRPLALRTNVKTGALVTECHHYCCQDISEHQQTRGYKFICNSNSSWPPNSAGLQTTQCNYQCNGSTGHAMQSPNLKQTTSTSSGPSQGQLLSPAGQCQHQESWSVWSPRMLHETLHQNSKSCLLYAKNNVLLETQAHGHIAGYLSLHQTSDDLLLKWIPNQLINGGQQQSSQLSTWTRPLNEISDHSCSRSDVSTISNRDHSIRDDRVKNQNKRARSLDNANSRRRGRWKLVEGYKASSSDRLRCLSSLNSSSNNSLVTSRRRMKVDCDNSLIKSQNVVRGSYLDLVVSLSVSRIVLLNCHFGLQTPHKRAQTDVFLPSKNLQINQEDDHTNDSTMSARDKAKLYKNDQLNSSDLFVNNQNYETLILVEADGVQRAPFKFPKGGLCWFLSCLESGLSPDKYLDPAIKLDAKTVDEDYQVNELADSSVGNTSTQSDSLLSQAVQSGTSRLDVILSRLPSLRRRSNDKLKSNDITATNNTSSSSQTNSRVNSPTPSQQRPLLQEQEQEQRQQQQSNHRTVPINYVYRIVSVNQSDWPLQTPPHSALSVASSTSNSSTQTGAKLMQHQAHNQQAELTRNGSQKFRWSLSRFARFSSRGYSTSSSSLGYANGHMDGDSLTSLHQNHNPSTTTGNQYNAQMTVESSGSFNDSIDKQSTSNQNNSSSTATEDQRPILINSNMKRDSSSELIRIESKLNNLKKNLSDELTALRDHTVQTLCEQMRKQILARAFYGWLAYCRRMKIIRNHLVKLIHLDKMSLLDESIHSSDIINEYRRGLTRQKWAEILNQSSELNEQEIATTVNQFVYYGGVEDNKLRIEVWPYLLGHYKFGDAPDEREAKDKSYRSVYENRWKDWIKIERIIKRRDQEILAANMAKVAREHNQQQTNDKAQGLPTSGRSISETSDDLKGLDSGKFVSELDQQNSADEENNDNDDDDEQEQHMEELNEDVDAASLVSGCGQKLSNQLNVDFGMGHQKCDNNHIEENKSSDEIQNGSIKTMSIQQDSNKFKQQQVKEKRRRHRKRQRRYRLESTGSVGSDASITDQFGNNIHRIDKDVQRCDRNFWYFKDTNNLDKLRNIMCSYVWQHLDVGYVQGMCDLAAPFLVIFDDEIKAFICFDRLMVRMVANFPHGSAMDQHFESLKYLMQVLDPKLFEVLQNNGDYTHFYFCYRWLLLDFKRELAYEDVFRVWETIWSARLVATDHFVVFLALAMVRFYRDIIIENNMDFTDTIKFFNEMAERHDVRRIIMLAQDSIVELENLIKN